MSLDDVFENIPDDDSNVIYVWPENLPVWNVWLRLQTQWRVSGGMGSRSGLDYAAVMAYFRYVERLRPVELTETFRLIQAMELTALDVWAQERQKQGKD